MDGLRLPEGVGEVIPGVLYVGPHFACSQMVTDFGVRYIFECLTETESRSICEKVYSENTQVKIIKKERKYFRKLSRLVEEGEKMAMRYTTQSEDVEPSSFSQKQHVEYNDYKDTNKDCGDKVRDNEKHPWLRPKICHLNSLLHDRMLIERAKILGEFLEKARVAFAGEKSLNETTNNDEGKMDETEGDMNEGLEKPIAKILSEYVEGAILGHKALLYREPTIEEQHKGYRFKYPEEVQVCHVPMNDSLDEDIGQCLNFGKKRSGHGYRIGYDDDELGEYYDSINGLRNKSIEEVRCPSSALAPSSFDTALDVPYHLVEYLDAIMAQNAPDVVLNEITSRKREQRAYSDVSTIMSVDYGESTNQLVYDKSNTCYESFPTITRHAIFIHCYTGKSRSPAIVAAYLMLSQYLASVAMTSYYSFDDVLRRMSAISSDRCNTILSFKGKVSECPITQQMCAYFSNPPAYTLGEAMDLVSHQSNLKIDRADPTNEKVVSARSSSRVTATEIFFVNRLENNLRLINLKLQKKPEIPLGHTFMPIEEEEDNADESLKYLDTFITTRVVTKAQGIRPNPKFVADLISLERAVTLTFKRSRNVSLAKSGPKDLREVKNERIMKLSNVIRSCSHNPEGLISSDDSTDGESPFETTFDVDFFNLEGLYELYSHNESCVVNLPESLVWEVFMDEGRDVVKASRKLLQLRGKALVGSHVSGS